MKYTESDFKKEVDLLYNGEIEIVSNFKGMIKPLLVKDKYGILSFSNARDLLANKPGIKRAVNQTEYFMNTLLEKFPETHSMLKPLSEYVKAKGKMLFQDKYGIVSMTPDSLLAGSIPSIRAAIDRKVYFKSMLQYIYGDRYDFIIETSDRKNGRSILICPIHGKVDIDNEYIFQGKGCPKCITSEESNVFYIIKLTTRTEEFFKLGISYITKGKVRRYSDYRKLGYDVTELKNIEFETSRECKDLELKLKRLIKNNTYTPKNWPHETSTECFTGDLLDIILNNL